MNYKCVVEYDGSLYCGWASQLSLLKPSVEKKINECLSRIYKQEIRIIGASRTDKGVHALHQVFSFSESKAKLRPKELKQILNKQLPKDIRIKSIEVVPKHFHARYDVVDKTYCYVINDHKNSKYNSALYSHYVWSINEHIKMLKLRIISHLFVGKHNFLSFSKSDQTNTNRTINWIKIRRKHGLVCIYINGNGFLRSMVRMIVAIMIDIDLKIRNIEDIKRLLLHPIKGGAVLLAPAAGLYLVGINYKKPKSKKNKK